MHALFIPVASARPPVRPHDQARAVIPGGTIFSGRLADASASVDVALGDVALLLGAVKQRLRGIVRTAHAAAGIPAPADPAEHLLAGVLECVAALAQLHATLTHEIARRHRLERPFAKARAALALHRSVTDGLVCVPNGGFFRGQLDQALNRALAHDAGIVPSLAVICTDLDGIEPINDPQGNAVGDALLRAVAVRLNRAVRLGEAVSPGSGGFACRLPGGPDRAALVRTAQSLLEIVSAPVSIGTLHLNVRASSGSAVYPEHGATPDALLHSAEAAMYREKYKKYEKRGPAVFDERVDVRSHASL